MSFDLIELKSKLESGELILYNQKVYTREKYEEILIAKAHEDNFDLLQMTRKIQLNSLYGSLLNRFFRFGRQEFGASVTATGRQITTHMLGTIGQLLTGEFATLTKTTNHLDDGTVQHLYHTDSPAVIYSDTDSVAGDSEVVINGRRMKIEDVENILDCIKTVVGEKHYIHPKETWMSPCFENSQVTNKEILGIYKHRVTKQKFTVTTTSNNVVKITADHSIMIIIDGELAEIKGDQLTQKHTLVELRDNSYHLVEISSIEESMFEDEWVYDIIMKDKTTPYFFANDILVHNSGYFLTLGNDIDEAVLIADSVAKQVNDSFPEFMEKSFNCKGEFSTLIKAGREVVAERGIFQAKKKYMLRVVDMEGKRVNKIKSQGSEIKKSDTPKMIQNFLKDIIDMILDGKPYQELVKRVNESRGTLITKKNLISLGVSKACNNLEAGYNEWKAFEKAGLRKVKLTGHVRAAINHNEIATLKQGKSAEHIRSGDKVMVFELKPNNYGFKSIAFSSDISKFPDWFDEFEVDLVQAEQKLIDAKLKGVFAAIGKDVPTIQGEHFDSLFEF